ncbi:MAG: hypothetical protein MUO35_14045, partial [Anaerolineales bacterium]|nr:hypothetical protein [Anaerolineales bacterium]
MGGVFAEPPLQAGIVPAAVPALSAQENGFLFRLSRELKAFGWADEEIGQFVETAQIMNWNGLEK